jgi:hypothetical protein
LSPFTGWQCGRLCLQNLVSTITWVTNLVDNPLSITPCLSHHASNVFSKRNASYWNVRALTLADFGCRRRRLSQLWRVPEPRPDLENLCGHDAGGILGADRRGLDNHSTVRNSLRARHILEWEQGC